MRPGKTVAFIIGCLLVIPSIAMLIVGTILGLGHTFGRGDDGYFDVTLDRLSSATPAIVTDDVNLGADPGSPSWLIEALHTDVRLRATSADTTEPIFIGIGRESDVDTYLAGVAHDELIEVDDLQPIYRTRSGAERAAAPTDQTIWVVSVDGVGTQQLEWEATAGRWTAVLMNADGSPGLAADVNVGATAPFILPLSFMMLGVGVVLTAVAIGLILLGTAGGSEEPPLPRAPNESGATIDVGDRRSHLAHPVTLEARLDPDLSRSLWLVKWFLAIPHVAVLAFLWLAFVILTVVAGVAILFTGRYPKSIFEFNVGVMRWSWRVSHYATTGGIGTDRYPRFSLHAAPEDAATLDVAYPVRLSRGLVLVKWLLALPHLLIVAILSGPAVRWELPPIGIDIDVGGGGLLGVLVLVTGVILLFSGRYPSGMFDLIVDLNRWMYRVLAYVALMTDDYPPFRLDRGGTDPLRPVGPPPVGEVDLRSSPVSREVERPSVR